jgi:ankyrin repeat protein
MPLLRAMRARDVEAVRLLLEFGADPNKTPPTPPSTGRADDAFLPRTTTPLFTAIAGGDGAKFGVGANITKEAEEPKVYRFPSERKLARVASLVIDAGAAVNATDEQGATALHLAARAGDDALVKVLVSHGANLKATDKEGLTALDYAEGKVGATRVRRGRAGAPQAHESTARLLRQLLNSATPQ